LHKIGHGRYAVFTFRAKTFSFANPPCVQSFRLKLNERNNQLQHFHEPVVPANNGDAQQSIEKIPDNTGIVLHSDQGRQYQMKQYQHRLQKKGIIQSMEELQLLG